MAVNNAFPVRLPWLIQIFGNVQTLSLMNGRAICLLLALGIYAVLGSPTPEHLGAAEAVMGILLLLACAGGLLRLWRQATLQPLTLAPWQVAGLALLVYSVSVLPVLGIARGHAVPVMLRDMAALLFLLLPLMTLDLLTRGPLFFRWFLAAALFSGWMFALRSLLDGSGFLSGEALMYLGNAPTVLLAAVLLPALAAFAWLQRPSLRVAVLLLLALGLAVIPVLAMASGLQRASLGYVGFYALTMLSLGLWFYPARILGLAGLILLAGAAALVFAGADYVLLLQGFANLTQDLMQKTHLVGLNSRTQEAEAVWAYVTQLPAGIILGGGWGAGFQSPAVAGLTVTYTHNLFTSFLLKSGVVGVFLAVWYLAGFALALAKLLFRWPVLALALAGPFLINVFLYASYKSLDFGVLLTLIGAALITAQLQETGEPCMQGEQTET